MLWIVVVISGTFFLRYEVVSLSEGLDISVIASALLDFGLFFLLMVIGCNYFNLIKIVSQAQLSRFYFALMALVLLSLVTLYNFDVILGDPILVVLLVLFTFIYFIFGDSLCNRICIVFPLRDNDRKYFLLNDPPRKRKDLIKLDFTIFIFIVMPFIVKAIWA